MTLRRKLSITVLLILFSFFAAISFAIPQLGGNFEKKASIEKLSPGADSLLLKVYEGLDPSLLRDYHAHIAGLGAGNTGCYVNSKMTSPLHPIENLKFNPHCSKTC
jgi:hypothetical protein